MKRKALLITFVSVTLTLRVIAQQPFSSSYEVQKIPANPDIAQLGRFGDIPVNKYNGTANVTIPIYSIDFDGLNIPIQVAYNTGGVRVEQEASWVGLGWSLSDGMTITRKVNGYEDIYNTGAQTGSSIGWIFNRDYLARNQEDGWAIDGNLSEPDLVEIQSYQHNNTALDLQPDFFTVNLPSGSCNFTLNKISGGTVTTVISDNRGFKIQYDHVGFNFTVTDPNGFIYYFTEKEYSTGYGSYETADTQSKVGIMRGIQRVFLHGKNMISSWRISKITSPVGRELNFTYEDGFYFSYPHFKESHKILWKNEPTFLKNTSQTVPSNVLSNTFATMTAFKVKNLSLITGDFGSVDFVLSDRSDLFSKQDKEELADDLWNTYLSDDTQVAKKVQQIIVKNKQQQIIKTATFGYSYFNNQWLNQEPDANDTDPFECDVSYLRLKLDYLDINDQRYQFEYIQPNALPRKDSRAIDFWGFHNGINNYTTVPSFNRFYVNHPGGTRNFEWHEFFIKLNGANRGANVAYGQIGNLQKVVYPTGGYSVFQYEGHKVTLSNVNYHPISMLSNGSGQLRKTSLQSSSSYNYSYQYLKLAKTPGYSLYDLNTCKISSTTINPETVFQITETSFCNQQDYNVEITFSAKCALNCGENATPSGKAVWLKNLNTQEETVLLTHTSGGTQATTVKRTLSPGTYQLKTLNWTQASPTVVYQVTGHLTKYYSQPITPLENEEFEVGGTRLASITNYDQGGKFISKSKYVYDQYISENGAQVSNGKLMDELIFHSKAGNLFDYTAVDYVQNTTGGEGIVTSESTIMTNPSAQGSHIGYNLVRELKVNESGSSIGSTVTEFYNKPNQYLLKANEIMPKILINNNPNINDFPSIDDLYPGHYYTVTYGSVYVLGARPITSEFANGTVLQEMVYDNNSNEAIRTIINDYQEVPVRSYSENGTSAESAYPFVYIFGNHIVKFQSWTKISRSSTRLNLRYQLNTAYENERVDNNILSRTTNNFYESSAHLNLTRRSTEESNGIYLTTKYFYPQDVSANPFMNNLITKNQLNTPVILEHYKGTASDPYEVLLEKIETFYNTNHSMNGHVLPSEVQTYTYGSTEGYKRVKYDRYTQYGALTQYRKGDEDFPISILWSYVNTLPIAQVTNAKHNEIAFSSFDEPSINDGNWKLMSGGTTSSAFKTGTKCLNAGSRVDVFNALPSGSYTVGFWARVLNGSSGTVSVNSTNVAISGQDWKYYETSVTGTTVSVLNPNVYIDELRLHPAGALMNSYTYKPLVGIASQTDANGKITFYFYDESGRLSYIKDNDGNIVKTFAYNYQN